MDILRKGNKDLIKDINRYTVLNLIREKGEITRTEIAKKCDFGMSTLTYILDDLQQEGIILEGAETSSTGGRRAKLVRFNKDYGFVVSVKVEEEQLLFALTDLNAEIIENTSIPFSSEKKPEEAIELIAKNVKKMCGNRDMNHLLGVGIAISGLVNRKKGTVIRSTMLGWENVALEAMLHAHFPDIPVYVDKNINCYTLAELWLGEGKKSNNFATVSVGAGLGLSVVINRDKEHQISIQSEPGTAIFGLGEKTGALNKAGSIISMWNTDVYSPHNKDTVELYQSIPFMIADTAKTTYGLFYDNSHRTEFDFQSFEEMYTVLAEGGQANLYIIFGEDVKEVVANYTDLTGKTPLPPKWSLGYHQSRYSYTSEEEVERIANTFKEKEIPLDCVFMDIHYMDDFRVFTFNPDTFPNGPELIARLREQNIDVVPIVDPGIKKDVDYSVYQEGIKNNYFCTKLEGSIYYGDVWPGVSAFPDFLSTTVQHWWGSLHKFYTDLGIRGIWNDMNEPSVFNESKTMDLDVVHNLDGKNVTHKEAHNLYGLYMSKATFEGLKRLVPNERPFSLTRAGYAGVQRYSAVWTGDNRSHWEHLEMSLPMIMNLGLSGVAFTGADVGGFSSDCTKEMLIRWTQAGAFLPYFRNHCVQDSIYQEPWAFGADAEKIVKQYIELRYAFLPYIYTEFQKTAESGLPLVRPLYMEFKDERDLIQVNDQFMLGENILVAPIVREGQAKRLVRLPKGLWFNYWTKEQFVGGDYIIADAPIDTMPIYIKAGTILPVGSSVQNTKETQELTLEVYLDSETATGYVYNDDGKSYQYESGAVSKTKLTATFKNGEVLINATHQGEANLQQKVTTIQVFGEKIDKITRAGI
ncbi:TPA_asm: alpha-glucosidase [Listeria monocytogenes]|nr:ROK family protein [Listeria monocytogenes]EGP6995899.1 ROK family protein [Listeria monocytogenes]EGP7369354.1 ROK family protein [Listeria monocytogenes]EGP8991416.1 ROK family protein [Listeria monocytogenes]EGP9463829.1 ROK family protein [Listeria monocytogenes]